jgi:invasion protein IalB
MAPSHAVLCTALLALSCGAALAQPAGPAAPPPAGNVTRSAPTTLIPRPERTTASYGDWVLQCENPANGASRCEVAQALTDARGQPTLNAVLQQAANPAQLMLSVQVGVNALVDEPARFEVGGHPALPLNFYLCLPRGCFAEALTARSDVLALVHGADGAKFEYRGANASPLSFVLSLRGLTTALDALQHTDRN